MKLIRTRYFGPTDFKGSRIKADEPDGKSVTVSYDYAASDDERNLAAAQKLADKMGWGTVHSVGFFGNAEFFSFDLKPKGEQ